MYGTGSIANVISTFVIEDHMLDWHSCQICYPLEIKILLLLLLLLLLDKMIDDRTRNSCVKIVSLFPSLSVQNSGLLLCVLTCTE